MVLEIDIENLMDKIAENNWYTEMYKIDCKKDIKYFKNSYDYRRKTIDMRYNDMNVSDHEVYSIIDILKMDRDTQRRMRIASRAVEKWRKKTGYERCIPYSMKKQIANFIFENGHVVKKHYFYNGVYENDD